MRPILSGLFALMLTSGFISTSAAQSREEIRDLRHLQQDLANLDEELRSVDPQDSLKFQERAEAIREETIYLKVKMRHHQKAGREGTGVDQDELADLRRSIADLRGDIDRATRRDTREVRVREGTEIIVRLEEPLSSRTARREDRVEASVERPVRVDGVTAIPAGVRVRGTVRDAEPAERPSRSGRLDLDLDALYVNQDRLDLRGHVIAIAGQQEEGGLDTREKAGLGALLGGVVGGIIGGKRGVVAGILLGGGGAVAATKGDDVDLPAGTILTFRLDRPLIVSRR
jgi:hypothetical protein